MQLGLHAYVQKPLAHEIFEVRRLTETAREKKLVTQMGIQIHSAAYYRIGVQVIRDGAIGKIRQTHSGAAGNGEISVRCPRDRTLCQHLNWDEWLGVCTAAALPCRLLPPGRVAQASRFRHRDVWRHGLPHLRSGLRGIGVTAPVSVRSEGPAHNAWNWSMDSIVHFVFPGTPYTEGPTVPVHLVRRRPAPAQGSPGVARQAAAARPGFDLHRQQGGDGIAAHRPAHTPARGPIQGYKLPRNSGTSHNKQFIDAVLGTAKTSAPSIIPARSPKRCSWAASRRTSREPRWNGIPAAGIQERLRREPVCGGATGKDGKSRG